MFAVVQTGGRQLQVSPADVVQVDRMDAAVGSEVSLDRVLLLRTDDQTHIGTPTVSGAEVRAEVLGHDRGEKIRVFFFRRRKNSKKTRGHRQHHTQLLIRSLILDGAVLAEAEGETATESAGAEETAAVPEAVTTVEETATEAVAAEKPELEEGVASQGTAPEPEVGNGEQSDQKEN